MSSSFWAGASECHQKIAKTFYDNIEYTHPKGLSGRSKRGVSWCNCSWCATRVKYLEYSGPSIDNIY